MNKDAIFLSLKQLNEYTLFGLGWIRNLVAEGIEPNPGPKWVEVQKTLREEFTDPNPIAPLVDEACNILDPLVIEACANRKGLIPDERDILFAITKTNKIRDDIIKLIKLIAGIADLSELAEMLEKLRTSAPKRFAINEALNAANWNGHYVLEETSWMQELVVKFGNKNQFALLLHGSRGSGKTTLCNLLTKYCPQWHFVYWSFQGFDFYHKVNIYQTIAEHLLTQHPYLKLYLGGIDRPKSGPEFLWWLLLVSSSMQKTRLVFVLDEFDALVDVSPPRSKQEGEEKKQDFTNETDPYENQSAGERVEEFLTTLRAVHNNEMFEKFSLLGVGTLSIITIETQYLSPFSMNEVVSAPKATQAQVRSLIFQFATQRQVTISEEVIKDIHSRCGGHIGFIAYCGRVLEDTFKSSDTVTNAEWLDLIVRKTREIKLGFVLRMLSRMDNDKIRSFICDNFLYQLDKAENPLYISFTPRSPECLMARMLAAEGLLDTDRDNPGSDSFCIPSPIVRSILIRASLSNLQILSHPLPVRNLQLDVVKLLKFGLRYFDKRRFTDPLGTKENRCGAGSPVKRDAPVPNEPAYQLALLQLLSRWLGSDWKVINEVTSEQKGSLDIYVENPDKSRQRQIAALEICCHLSDAEVAEHIYRTQHFCMPKLHCTEGFVINFTTQPPHGAPGSKTKPTYVWEGKSTKKYNTTGIIAPTVIHIYHNLNWTEASMITMLQNQKEQKIEAIDLK